VVAASVSRVAFWIAGLALGALSGWSHVCARQRFQRSIRPSFRHLLSDGHLRIARRGGRNCVNREIRAAARRSAAIVPGNRRGHSALSADQFLMPGFRIPPARPM